MADPVQDYLSKMHKPVIPEFVVEAVKLEHRSQQEGRPIYEDREFVNIMIVGQRGATVHEPVNDEHKMRWPKEYAAFKAGRELPPEGTPLAEWPDSTMTKARVMELAFFNIRTVEDLAAVHDNALGNLGMGARELREKARTFLEIALHGTGPIERLVMGKAEAEREVVRLTDDLVAANIKIKELESRLAAKGGDYAGAGS